MNRIGRNLSIILRAEQLIARRRMAVIRTRTVIMAAAGLAAGMGLIMMDVAAFLALKDLLSAPGAALSVGLANLALGLLLALGAYRISADQDLEPVTEVRDIAVEELEAELRVATEQARELADNVRRIARDPMSTIAPNLIAPLVALLLKAVRKQDQQQ